MEHENDHEFDIDNFEKVERSALTRALMITVSLLVVVGLVYISGVQQYFFYQRTPTTAEQPLIESRVDAELLVVPLTIFIITGSQEYGSVRTDENALNLVENASRIWGQAGVTLSVENIFTVVKSDIEIQAFSSAPVEFIQTFGAFDPATINVFLVGNLGGINGISFGGLRSVAVADYTTVYDFRALAHEVGHTLGLSHVPELRGRLMYQGANGSLLSSEEIQRARLNAQGFE